MHNEIYLGIPDASWNYLQKLHAQFIPFCLWVEI
jgi:hypothetical protein